MICRDAVLSAILLTIVIPACAADYSGQTFKGLCGKSSLAESDGVKIVTNGMRSKEFFAATRRAKSDGQTIETDGLAWSIKPLQCDSVTIIQMKDYPGHTLVIFSDGPKNPILGFEGGRINGDGPLFFSSIVYLSEGKGVPLNPGSGHGCHFYFTDHGTFTDGWENRLTAIECDLSLKTEAGRLVRANVAFSASQTPVAK